MSEIAFVTYEPSPEINVDDQLVADLLNQRGIRVTAAVWDAPHVNWSQFNGVIIRSAWDYHLKARRYEQWLQMLLAAGVPLWNPAELVLENINKRYLTAFANRGISVVPTVYQPASTGVVLSDLLQKHGWDGVVIKPAVSASANGTWRTTLATAEQDQTRFSAEVHRQDMLIQPYIPEIATHGEWSLVFFNGIYSHAVLKLPAKGDFRVQREFGGRSVPATPNSYLIEQAQSILSTLGQSLLYARVDGVDCNGRFLLMEFEINEPLLFLGFATGAPERFAHAIMQTLRSR